MGHVEESAVDQAKRYIESRKGWRPQRRTVIYLAAMLVILVFSALVIPRLLPGRLQNGEAVVGRDGGVATIPVGTGGAAKNMVEKPGDGQGYTAWAVSDTREEVAVAWFRGTGEQVERAAVQVRSAYSGRNRTEWSYVPDDGKPVKITQVGFIPQHNLIWFLAGGRIILIDIKSGQVLPLPFKGAESVGQIPEPDGVTYASFSPSGGLLAYSQGGSLNVVTGLGIIRGTGKLGSTIVLEAGKTPDGRGSVVQGAVECFAWLDEAQIAVVMRQGEGASQATPVYLVSLEDGGGSRVRPLMAAGEQRVLSISRAPKGTDFAMLVVSGQEPQPGGPPEYRVLRSEASGKLLRPEKLPTGNWTAPLSWTSS